MSRAFVKDSDTPAGDTQPELAISGHTNYVTPRGLRLLRERQAKVRAQRDALKEGADALAQQAELAALERELRWLDVRTAGAIVVDPDKQPHDRVAFGAHVTVDSAEGERRWHIVGEDEADAEHGLVSYVSPLAKALLGARVGDEVNWTRPAGMLALEVLAIDYDKAPPE